MATGLAAIVLAAVPAGAAAQLDYSKNSVNGEYQVSPAAQRVNHLDYSKNSVNGQDNAATPSSPAPTSAPPVRAVNTGGSSGFHWGDAGIGAGAVIVLTLVVGIGGTVLLGRRTGSRPAS
jgi:hypothetical protein